MCTGKFYNTINIISFFVLSNVTELPALEFWKKEESSFPYLAKIAKKYLGVQASSVAVERMFSISGHIFSLKRRRLGDIMFADLVYTKLNEDKL